MCVRARARACVCVCVFVSGAVNTQGFVWKVFMRYIKMFINSFKLPGLTESGIERVPTGAPVQNQQTRETRELIGARKTSRTNTTTKT